LSREKELAMSVRCRDSIGALLVAAVCLNSRAGISQSTLVSPGGVFQAGADPAGVGSFSWPGDDLALTINGAGSMLNEGLFSGIGTATRSASATAANLNNNANGSTGMGYVLLNAFNNAPNNAAFPLGAAHGGWKDTFTVANPAHTGQAGFLQFTIDASGFLEATGFAGASSIRVTAYKDNTLLMANQFSSPGDSDLIGTTNQYGNWDIATFGNPNQDSKSVRGTATFAVPMTFGTPFTLGVYGWGLAGMRFQSGVGGNSTALVEDGKIRWGGILNVFAGTTPVTAGSTVSSASGMDWRFSIQPPDPCPGDFNIDGVVDDADFVIFVNAYNILDCADPTMPDGCVCDMNGDGFVDDADFVDFVVAYNNLTCV